MSYCPPCERSFGSESACTRHLQTATVHLDDYCRMCDRLFDHWNALSSHYANSSRHDWCSICRLELPNRSELIDHLDANHPACCGQTFVNQTGLHEHYRQAKSHAGKYCVPCQRIFQTPANYQAHSLIHLPKNFGCPAPSCSKAFTTPSAVVLHLESGNCASGINRALIDRVVAQYDRNSFITDPNRRMITAGQNASHYPSPAPPPPTFATERSWNGDGYECFLCPNLREFGSLDALNRHLGSPKHYSTGGPGAGKLYRCPKVGCGKKQETLSGLVQHIERGGCGVREIRGVQGTIDNVMAGFSGLRIGY